MLADEDRLVANLIEKARCSEDEQREIGRIAEKLVQAARAGRNEAGGVDSFLHEYGLSSREGVLLLCLAEALLRIPDATTADRLIAGTIGSGDWSRHVGHSESLLVNASTWGLMLTGRILDWSEARQADPASMVRRLIARSGEPVIRQALRQAIRILGNQFVLGETIATSGVATLRINDGSSRTAPSASMFSASASSFAQPSCRQDSTAELSIGRGGRAGPGFGPDHAA